MNNYPDTTVFARLSEDKTQVVEYPVFALHIRNRAHPFDWYAKAVFDTKPEVPAFHTLKEILTVRDGSVLVSYKVVADTLDQVLSTLYKKNSLSDLQGQVVETVAFADVPTATIKQIKELSKNLAQAQMDAFAAEKEYDNIASACSYIGSSISAFKSDAEKCIPLRDNTWVALYNYFEKVASGEKPVPKSSAEIKAVLPALVW